MINYKSEEYKQRKKCVKYLKQKKPIFGDSFSKESLEIQKQNVQKAIPRCSFFGNTPEVYFDEMEIIDQCIANWDEYSLLLN